MHDSITKELVAAELLARLEIIEECLSDLLIGYEKIPKWELIASESIKDMIVTLLESKILCKLLINDYLS